jgi:hypothetical protein
VSFPVAEVLKPMGFKERSDVRIPPCPQFEPGKGSGKREFSRGGSIETDGFQGAKRRSHPSLPTIRTRKGIN